ncbi:MAG: transcriptional regulator [Clostridia bacterium]
MENQEVRFYKRMALSLSDPEPLRVVAHALSTELRLQILHLLNFRTMNVVEISAALGVPISTIAINIETLENANLITSEQVAGTRGRQKRCNRVTDSISLDLMLHDTSIEQSGFISMPIGAFSSCTGIQPSCGLAGTKDYLGLQDEPLCFYSPERLNAQIVWFRQGFVEYRFPVMQLQNPKLHKLEILFEACSETIGYDNHCKSDISVLVNGLEIGCWESPGDFGGRKGLLNPDWWPSFSSQYGMLKSWRITEEGTFLDSVQVSSVTLSDLKIKEQNYLSLQIGVKANAPLAGGVNLFGHAFGDFPQDIVLRYYTA